MGKRRQFSLAQLLLLTMLGAALCTYYSAVIRTGLENYHVSDVVISPEGRWFAHDSSRGLAIFDLQSGDAWLTIEDGAEPAFSPDERRVAYARQNSVEAWDLESRQLVRSWSTTGYPRYPRSLAFAADGALVIDRFGEIERRSLPGGELVGAATIRDGFSYAVGTTSDGSFLAVECTRKYPGYTVEVWDCRSGTLAHILTGSEDTAVRDLVFSPDDKLIAAAMHDGIRLWNRETGDMHARLKLDGIRCVAFSTTGERIGFVDFLGFVRIWNLADNDATIVGQVAHSGSCDVEFVNNDRELRAAGRNGTVEIIRVDQSKTTRELLGLHLPPPVPTGLWFVMILVGAAWLILWYCIKPRRDDSATDYRSGDLGWHLVLITALVTFVLALPFVGSDSYLNPGVICLMIAGSLGTLVATLISLSRFRHNVACLMFSISVNVAVFLVGCCLLLMAFMYHAG